jgi:hypothetical protein
LDASVIDEREERPMDADVVTDIEIDRPRSQVADYALNPDNATEWYENIKKVEWKSPRPLREGAQGGLRGRVHG